MELFPDKLNLLFHFSHILELLGWGSCESNPKKDHKYKVEKYGPVSINFLLKHEVILMYGPMKETL